MRGWGNSVPPYLSVNIKGGQMYDIVFFNKYISHKSEIKVNS